MLTKLWDIYVRDGCNKLTANAILIEEEIKFVLCLCAVGTGTDTKPIDKIVVRGNHVVFNDNPSTDTKSGLMQAHGKPIFNIELLVEAYQVISTNSYIFYIRICSGIHYGDSTTVSICHSGT